MSLITCTECGKEFSDKAPACPNCGCPTKTSNESNSTILYELEGVVDILKLYNNRVVIQKKNILSSRRLKGEKVIFLNRINGVQVKHANMVISGYIHFAVNGGKEDISISDAPNDENTVMFRKKQNKDADKIHQMIINIIK